MKTKVLLLGGDCEGCGKRIEDRVPLAKLCGPCNYTRRRDRAKLLRSGYKVPTTRETRIKVAAARFALGGLR